jgi:hypothetical protein
MCCFYIPPHWYDPPHLVPAGSQRNRHRNPEQTNGSIARLRFDRSRFLLPRASSRGFLIPASGGSEHAAHRIELDNGVLRIGLNIAQRGRGRSGAGTSALGQAPPTPFSLWGVPAWRLSGRGKSCPPWRCFGRSDRPSSSSHLGPP